MTKHRYLPLVIVCAISLTIGCVMTGADIRSNVKSGMTKEEVISAIGKPDGYRKEGKYEAMQYSGVPAGRGGNTRINYAIILKNGEVVEYGTGKVKQKNNSNILFVVPL